LEKYSFNICASLFSLYQLPYKYPYTHDECENNQQSTKSVVSGMAKGDIAQSDGAMTVGFLAFIAFSVASLAQLVVGKAIDKYGVELG